MRWGASPPARISVFQNIRGRPHLSQHRSPISSHSVQTLGTFARRPFSCQISEVVTTNRWTCLVYQGFINFFCFTRRFESRDTFELPNRQILFWRCRVILQKISNVRWLFHRFHYVWSVRKILIAVGPMSGGIRNILSEDRSSTHPNAPWRPTLKNTFQINLTFAKPQSISRIPP